MGGTVVGALLFWAWAGWNPVTAVDFLAMGVLLWVIMGLAPRNYGYACIAITLMALLMNLVLTSDISPVLLAEDRMLATAVGAGICLLALVPEFLRRRRTRGQV